MNTLLKTKVRYETLKDVNRAAITHSTADAVFAEMCSSLSKIVPYDRAGLMMYEPEEDALKVVGLRGSLPGSFFHLLSDRRKNQPRANSSLSCSGTSKSRHQKRY